MKKTILLLLLIILLPAAAQAQMKNKIFSLNHRQAAELVPVIEPLIAGQGRVSGIRNQLVVRTTAENLKTIADIVRQLDAPPIQLVVTVRQGVKSELERESAEITADVPIGDAGRISVPPSPGETGGTSVTGVIGDAEIQGRVSRGASSASAASTQSVTTLEGKPAEIHLGSTYYVRNQRGAALPSSEMRASVTGVALLPRLSGTTVTVEVNPVQSTRSAGQVRTQETITTVRGELGEWIEVSALADQSSRVRTGILKDGRVVRKEARSVFLKVEVKR